jgi:hypothetical protein
MSQDRLPFRVQHLCSFFTTRAYTPYDIINLSIFFSFFPRDAMKLFGSFGVCYHYRGGKYLILAVVYSTQSVIGRIWAGIGALFITFGLLDFGSLAKRATNARLVHQDKGVRRAWDVSTYLSYCHTFGLIKAILSWTVPLTRMRLRYAEQGTPPPSSALYSRFSRNVTS